ncbi:hypothetical protein BFW87_00460 [Pseudomonas fluorescens]|uniref:Response regulatory domain-containing protein n=1 Tax=Pseudomonas fluorescens TaxID=294 RepID=A0A1T2Z9Z1_PSEFL|nr:hypothetical protein [Pseudomonas fluorescens]OPB00918.1 hypothetical protein BFW87_00460 [Pseudomonas fluorescens]
MINKSTRILIVDQQHARRLYVEKILNKLGCYRIAPMNSFEEFVAVTRYGKQAFDLLIINRQEAKAEELDGFCKNHPMVRNTLVYESQSLCYMPPKTQHYSSLRVDLQNLPDGESLYSMMRAIDHLQNVKRLIKAL